jgi:hypothetical protein
MLSLTELSSSVPLLALNESLRCDSVRVSRDELDDSEPEVWSEAVSVVPESSSSLLVDALSRGAEFLALMIERGRSVTLRVGRGFGVFFCCEADFDDFGALFVGFSFFD